MQGCSFIHMLTMGGERRKEETSGVNHCRDHSTSASLQCWTKCWMDLTFSEFPMILHFFRNVDSFCVWRNIWEYCLSAHVFMRHLIISLPYLTYFVVVVMMRPHIDQQTLSSDVKWQQKRSFDLACSVITHWATLKGQAEICILIQKKPFWKRERERPGVKESLKTITSLLGLWATWPMRSDGVIVAAAVQVGAAVAFEFTIYSGGSSLLFSHLLTVYQHIRKLLVSCSQKSRPGSCLPELQHRFQIFYLFFWKLLFLRTQW